MITEKFFVIASFGHQATMWILILLSVLSVAFIIERWISLGQVKKTSDGIRLRLTKALQSLSLQDIEDIARERDSFEGQALAQGLKHAKEFGAEGLEEVFNSYAQLERPDLEKRLNFLATVGSNAPFIGLLGTVFGIMDAFRGLATSQGEIQAVLIGISQALVATATGLMVAIPAVIAFNFFQKRVRHIIQGLEIVRDVCISYAKSRKASH